eukprot:1206322-Prymnesium_polylepis.1
MWPRRCAGPTPQVPLKPHAGPVVCLQAEIIAPETYELLEDTLRLFRCIKVEHERLLMLRAGSSIMQEPPADEYELFRKGIGFETFYIVLAFDEMEMERAE